MSDEPLPVVVNAALEPVRGCEEGGTMGDSHICVYVCTSVGIPGHLGFGTYCNNCTS